MVASRTQVQSQSGVVQMSKLKAFDIVVAEEGYYEGIVKYRRAVYDKSEADKVIEEKRR